MLIARQLHVKCTQNARNCVIKCCQWTFLYCVFLLGGICCQELCSIDACAILRIRQRHLNTIRQQFQCSLSKAKWLSMCQSENKSRTKMCVSPATTYTHTHTHTYWLLALSAVKCSRCASVFVPVCVYALCVAHFNACCACHRFQLFSISLPFFVVPFLFLCVCVCVEIVI